MRKVLTLLLLLGFGASAKAQIPQPDPDTTARHFLIVASIKNLQEVSAGKLAAQKATGPEVKAFGLMMADAHYDAELKLLQLAKSIGIELPPAATGHIQPDLLLLNAGSEFDRLYVHDMISAHQNAVEVFRNYATTGKNLFVKTFAQQQLPALKRHLDEIKAIGKKQEMAAR